MSNIDTPSSGGPGEVVGLTQIGKEKCTPLQQYSKKLIHADC
jgi:hypothetical protein